MALRIWLVCLAAAALSVAPASAGAWGYKAHQVIAIIARDNLTPAVRARVDAILATDPDTITAPDMASRATWADTYRNGHRETAAWHFVDQELDHPDLSSACFGFPATGPLASTGPAQDCLVDKLEEFVAELKAPTTPAAERILALKYVLHFVGDLHQPLHTADNQDRGGNCVLVSLGGSRTTNLHSYWDTGVFDSLGGDPAAIAQLLEPAITPSLKAQWEVGDLRAWAAESYEVAASVVYTVGSSPGCDQSRGPITFPAGYSDRALATAETQVERAGVRLALVLNTALASS